MLRMTKDNIKLSYSFAVEDYNKAQDALIERVGESQSNFIVAVGNVFRKLVSVSANPLEDANAYYLKQGWKLASNYDLEDYLGGSRMNGLDEYCDYIEAAFRLAIIREIGKAYADPNKRKDSFLALSWQRYGYHNEPAALAA
ncbi:hypothetical protein ELG97_37055 [Rhizobium leguminosarum]|uniref:hypothetical protein n=1 Tax=Rhizobium leguminosarum TaxID=384 RepID=UPI0010318192|nr:hypothetical protein [Rhizobium leguminosarum]TBE73840.1 hypothetical protein ELG97_37055 [Rhizobium leguminosarum]